MSGNRLVCKHCPPKNSVGHLRMPEAETVAEWLRSFKVSAFGTEYDVTAGDGVVIAEYDAGGEWTTTQKHSTRSQPQKP